MTDHPYIVLCDEACCAPDTYADCPNDLAARWMRMTGGAITAAEVAALADDFWARLDAERGDTEWDNHQRQQVNAAFEALASIGPIVRHLTQEVP